MDVKLGAAMFCFWLMTFTCAVVEISIKTPLVEIGSPVEFLCKETNSSHKSTFRWHLDGKPVKTDKRSSSSSWTIPNFKESELNQEVKCTYGFEFDIINKTSYKDIFQYIPKRIEMSGKYTRDTNYINLELNMKRVYPVPVCVFKSKTMILRANDSSNDLFYNVNLQQKWQWKYFKCNPNLKPMCSVRNMKITDIPEFDCPETTQSFVGVCIVVLLLVFIPYIGFYIVFSFRQHDIDAESTTTVAQRRSIFFAISGNSFLYGYNMADLNNPAATIIAYYTSSEPSEVETREYVDTDYYINLMWSSVNAVYVLAGFIGVLCAEKIASKYGRRKPMMVNTILGMIASGVGGLTFVSKSIMVLILHRILIGIYCGIGLILSGMYAMEISKFTLNRVKGSYGTYDKWFQLSITAGICVSSFLGISTFLGNEDRWQWLLVINVVPVLSNIFLYWCPESPVFLIFQGETDMAKKALEILCPSKVDKEMHRLKAELKKQKNLTFLSFRKLFNEPKLKVGLFLVCFLQVAQQLSGINTVTAYSGFIYQGSGVEIELIDWMVFGTTLINFVMTTFSLTMMQNYGRRSVMIESTRYMGVAFFVLFVSSSLCEHSQILCPYIAVLSVSVYIVCYSLGLGPIPYIVVQEFFDQDAQGAAFNASVAFHWICNCLVIFVFRMLQMSMGSYVYLMFSIITFVLCLMMFKILPETKDMHIVTITNSSEYKYAKRILCRSPSEIDQSKDKEADENDPLQS